MAKLPANYFLPFWPVDTLHMANEIIYCILPLLVGHHISEKDPRLCPVVVIILVPVEPVSNIGFEFHGWFPVRLFAGVRKLAGNMQFDV